MLLTPTDALLRVDTLALEEGLRRAGLLGSPIPGIRGGFLAGERFLQLITFAGCSVRVELTPPASGGGFCFLRIVGPSRRPVLMWGRNTRPPRCPACRNPCGDWRGPLTGPATGGGGQLTCTACGEAHPAWTWDWKGTAGFGRCFLVIEEIFPGEATPAPALNAALERVTGSPWRHFYVQD